MFYVQNKPTKRLLMWYLVMCLVSVNCLMKCERLAVTFKSQVKKSPFYNVSNQNVYFNKTSLTNINANLLRH